MAYIDSIPVSITSGIHHCSNLEISQVSTNQWQSSVDALLIYIICMFPRFSHPKTPCRLGNTAPTWGTLADVACATACYRRGIDAAKVRRIFVRAKQMADFLIYTRIFSNVVTWKREGSNVKVPHLAGKVWVRNSYSMIGKVLNKQKQEKPLEEDGGKAPGVRLSVWSYKSKLLTPKPKA